MSGWLVAELEAPKTHLGVVSYLPFLLLLTPYPTWGQAGGMLFNVYFFTTIN